MTKTLIVAEKPSVAKDLAAALGGCRKVESWWESDSVVITSAIGHLIAIDSEIATIKGRTLNTLPVIPQKFDLKVDPNRQDQFFVVKRLMSRYDCSSVVNACDAGREGELIFRLIYNHAGCKLPISRLWIQSMNPDALRKGMSKLRTDKEMQSLADAAYCRSEADWIVGINGSRGVTALNRILTGIYENRSVGRVQTPTLAMVVDHENFILNFVPEIFWELTGTFKTSEGSYKAKWVNTSIKAADGESFDEAEKRKSRITDKNLLDELLAKCKGVDPTSVEDRQKPKRRYSGKLYEMTSLQHEANKRFKLSAQKTLDIAQSLYERHKVITYPRTGSDALPEDYAPTVKSTLKQLRGYEHFGPHIDKIFDKNWVNPSSKYVFDNSRITDHFAIIPTGTMPGSMTKEEAQVFNLIMTRFVEVFFPAAIYSETERITIVSGETFRVSGSVLVDPGFLVVDGYAEKSGVGMCNYVPGSLVKTTGMAAKESKTKAPERLTEGKLLGLMETAGKKMDDESLRDTLKEIGLGTPATRASIIEGLLDDGSKKQQKIKLAPGEQPRLVVPYLVREGKEQFLVPTHKAMSLIAFLRENSLEALTSAAMTGEWEKRLMEMEKGTFKRETFMKMIADETHRIIDIIQKKGNVKPIKDLEATNLGCTCPKCKEPESVNSNGEGIYCSKCDFKIFSIVASHAMTKEEQIDLITKGRSEAISTFISRNGKPFTAHLLLDPQTFRVQFQFPDQINAEPVPDSVVALKVLCPRCKKGEVKLKGGTSPRYACVNGDFTMWQRVSGHLITEEEANELMDGKTVQVKDLYSARTKNTFNAGLKLSADLNKVEFVF